MGHHHPQVEGGPRGHRLRAARGDPGLGAAKEVEAGRFGWIFEAAHPSKSQKKRWNLREKPSLCPVKSWLPKVQCSVDQKSCPRNTIQNPGKKPNKSKKQLASTNEETHGNTKRKLANRSNNSQEKHGKTHRIQEKLNKQQGQPWDFRWEIGIFIHQKPQKNIRRVRIRRNHRWVKLSIKNWRF